MESLEHVIWQICPEKSPFLPMIHKTARLRLAKQHGQAMRKRRRGLAKPLKFTPRSGWHRFRDWHLDSLIDAYPEG